MANLSCKTGTNVTTFFSVCFIQYIAGLVKPAIADMNLKHKNYQLLVHC